MVVALHNAKDGARKRSSKTIPLLAFESGIAHLLRLPRYKLMEQHDKVAEAFGKRRIKIAKKAVFQNLPQALTRLHFSFNGMFKRNAMVFRRERIKLHFGG